MYMPMRPIRSEAEYDTSLAEVDALMGAAPDTPEGGRLEVLSVLIEAYEAEHWPIAAPDQVGLTGQQHEGLAEGQIKS